MLFISWYEVDIYHNSHIYFHFSPSVFIFSLFRFRQQNVLHSKDLIHILLAPNYCCCLFFFFAMFICRLFTNGNNGTNNAIWLCQKDSLKPIIVSIHCRKLCIETMALSKETLTTIEMAKRLHNGNWD